MQSNINRKAYVASRRATSLVAEGVGVSPHVRFSRVGLISAQTETRVLSEIWSQQRISKRISIISACVGRTSILTQVLFACQLVPRSKAFETLYRKERLNNIGKREHWKTGI